MVSVPSVARWLSGFRRFGVKVPQGSAFVSRSFESSGCSPWVRGVRLSWEKSEREGWGRWVRECPASQANLAALGAKRIATEATAPADSGPS